MIALLIVVYSLCGLYMLFNFKHDIQMLQQNSYRVSRYWRYLQSNDVASAWRLCDVAMLFFVFARFLNVSGIAIFLGIYSIARIIFILRRKHKKPLVFTKRVWRIYCVSSFIFIGLFLWAIFRLGFQPQTELFYNGPLLTFGIFLFMSVFSWMIVIISVWVLDPVERMITRRYVNDAKRILKSIPSLKVIGITGSYGKTSTKHYLYRILTEKYDVLMTPGSFNTPMGVVRTIRELMKPYYQVFICEMGAKQKGDIKEICDIVHPEFGIVTAVGPMHLETFKSIENVQATKFELIDALPKDGFAVINNDFDKCASREVVNVETARYSTNSERQGEIFTAENIVYSPDGTSFSVLSPTGKKIELQTKLVGECNVSNLLAAVVVALKLGLTDSEIQKGVNSIDQVEHRLSIKKTPGGITILDDAFNSNPTGSKMALDVLSEMKEGRRIIVTPGMIELGEKQYELNKEFGEKIASSADIAIVVGEYNKDAILDGLKKGGMDNENIVTVKDFNESQKYLSDKLKKGDTVLYENDLPDTFK